MPKAKILIVDDEQIVALDIRKSVETMGYFVCAVASSGEEAVQKAGETRPDLTLMDIVLKGEMDGIKAAEQINALFKIPIVYLTAYDDEDILQRAKITTPYGYITKPFNDRELRIAIEITLYKNQAEAKIRKTELWLAAVLRSVGDGVIASDRVGRITFMNQMAEKLTGWKQGGALEKKLTEVLNIKDEELGDLEKHLVEKVITQGLIINLLEDRLLIAKDGTAIPISDSLAPIRDDDGETASTVLVFRDITQRLRAEEALRDSEEKFRLAMDATNDGLWDWNMVTNEVYRNPRHAVMLGYEPQDFSSSQAEWKKLIHPDDKQKVSDCLRAHIKGETLFFVLEYRLKTKSGDYLWVLGRGKVVAYDNAGTPIRMIGTNVDITERKQAEEEKRSLEERLNRSEKMEALGTLAGGVAHDLNNVLGVVVGYSEMLLDDVDKTSPLRRGLETIMNGGQRAAAIVDDLLTLARRGVPGRTILNLNKIIADCQKSPEFESLSFHHPSVNIKTDIDPDLLNISGSSVHLGKSLYNLVSNAGEAMPKGGIVTIKITNQYLDKPIQGYDQIRAGDYVVLSVSDTGEGIHEADLKRIFEPFYTKKVMGRSGTGLGLAVVWGTVKDHNGYINVESEKGKGSTFTLYFPVTREEITAEAVSVAISKYTGNGESILVVDDVKEQRDLAAGMLLTLNYNVSSVSSGEAAVAYLKEHKIDLMVLDMIMDPGMDGLDTYKKVLEIRPNQKAIIVSGFSESDRVRAARDLGSGAYVRKPYIKEKLGLAVRKEMDRK